MEYHIKGAIEDGATQEGGLHPPPPPPFNLVYGKLET